MEAEMAHLAQRLMCSQRYVLSFVCYVLLSGVLLVAQAVVHFALFRPGKEVGFGGVVVLSTYQGCGPVRDCP